MAAPRIFRYVRSTWGGPSQLPAPDSAGRIPITTSDVPATVLATDPNGRFLLKAGTHSGRTFDFASSSYNLADVLAEPGAVLDGGGANIRAFKGGANGVKIRGWDDDNRLLVKNYVPTASQSTAVMGGVTDASESQQDGWVFGYLDIEDCGQVAFRTGNFGYAGYIDILRAKVLGISGGGINTSDSKGLIEHVRIIDSNTDDAPPGFEGGASKFAVSKWLVFRDCEIIGNPVHASAHDGYGLWFDVDCEHFEAYNFTVSHVPRAAVVAEISGAGSIHDFATDNCGYWWSAAFENVWGYGFGAAVQICSSGHGPTGDGLAISRLTATDCYEGIVIVEQGRGHWQFGQGATDHYSQDVQINDNAFVRCGPSGLLTDIGTWSSATSYSAGGNAEHSDASHVVRTGRLFRCIQAGTNHTPPASNTSDAWWHFIAVVPEAAGRNLKWGGTSDGGNDYTSYTANASISGGPFYWPGGDKTFSQWRTLGQDVVGSGSTYT